jgi:hypothetical protein
MLGCWRVWHGVTIYPRKFGSIPWRWNMWPLSVMKWAFDEGRFSRRRSPVSVKADASWSLCKHAWANLHAWHAVNCFKLKNTVQYNLIHWRNKYSSFPRWCCIFTLNDSSDLLYKHSYLCNWHNSYLILLTLNFIPYIIIIIRYVKFCQILCNW